MAPPSRQIALTALLPPASPSGKALISFPERCYKPLSSKRSPTMLMKASEVAALLHKDESAVIKWIKREKLPAVMVRGSYRINRVDLLEWATEHGITVPSELF